MVNHNDWIQKMENNPVMDDDFTVYQIMAVARCCPNFKITSEEVFINTLNEVIVETVIALYQGYGYDITV